MESLSILLVISLIGATLAEDVLQQSPTLQLLTRRFKRQQGTLQQQLQSIQNTQQQQQQQNQGSQSNNPNNNFWSNVNSNTGGAGGFQTPSQNTNQGSATTTDAETQRINDCIQRNCRQGIQLASLCGTDNVSYKNRPYFNCVRDCGRRIEFQHAGDCFTSTKGPPTALSVG